MNNWDVQHKITVVLSENNVSDYATSVAIAEIMADREYWETDKHSFTGYGKEELSFEVSNDTNIPQEQLLSVMSCVNDHVLNVERSDLEQVFIDQTCATEEHIEQNIECHSAMDSCTVIDIYQSDYRADGVAVELYYVRLA